jgi:aminoglycoside/choline kinase family phosphotransferase
VPRAPDPQPVAPPEAQLLSELAGWLAARGAGVAELEPLAGDVSTRRYVRLRWPAGGSAIAAFYPEALRAQLERFTRAAALLDAAGVRVPRILDQEPARGWMLVEDLGPETLYDRRGALGWPELERHFAAALAAREQIAALDLEAVRALGSPPLDAALLRRELEQTERLLFVPRGVYAEGAAARRFAAALDTLCGELGAEPPIPCHRDLMARNLMPGAAGTVAVIDFQDLRPGPPAYDVASLCNDSLFPPPAVEARLLARAGLGAAGSLSYRRAVAQRALKAAGTFAAFAARGMTRHLPLIAPTLGRAAAALGEIPETAAAWSAIAPRAAALLAPAPTC